jgi:hypothetical protein
MRRRWRWNLKEDEILALAGGFTVIWFVFWFIVAIIANQIFGMGPHGRIPEYEIWLLATMFVGPIGVFLAFAAWFFHWAWKHRPHRQLETVTEDLRTVAPD